MARDSALSAIKATSMAAAQAHISNAATFMARSRDGYDADRDGTIESIIGEGGALQAHVGVQDMGGYNPTEAVAAPTMPPKTGDTSFGTYALIALASGLFLLVSGGYLLRRRSTT